MNIQGQTTVTSEGNAIEVESGALFQLNDTSAITGKKEGIYSKGGTISISRGTITSTTDNELLMLMEELLQVPWTVFGMVEVQQLMLMEEPL